MIFAASAFLFAALEIVSPLNESAVSLLRDGQRNYFAAPRAERLKKWKDAAFRNSLVKIGSTQKSLKLEWRGCAPDAEVNFLLESDGREVLNEVFTNRTSVFLTNLEIGRVYRWRVISGAETNSASFLTVDEAPRALFADGVVNFRDLGGWKTKDGRHVRQNRIFRSAGLRFSAKNVGRSMLNPKYEPGGVRISELGADTLLNEFGIRTDVELRTVQECACMKSSVLGEDIAWIHIPFAAYDFVDNLTRGKEPFAKLFETFSDERKYPILFHCSGGRDRTGTLAFLLNGLLGVSEEDLCRDWEFSAFFDSGMSFSPDRLERLLDYIHSLPGEDFNAKVESYARSCGITSAQIAAFRSLMLE